MAAHKTFLATISRASALAGRHPHVTFRAAFMEALSKQKEDYASLRIKVRPTLPQKTWKATPSEVKAFVEPASLSEEELEAMNQSPNKRAIALARGNCQEKVGMNHMQETVKVKCQQKSCVAQTPEVDGVVIEFRGRIDLLADGTVIEVKTRMGPEARQNEYDIDQLCCYVHALKAEKGILREILSTGEVCDTEYSGEELEERWIILVGRLKRVSELLNGLDKCSSTTLESLRKKKEFAPSLEEF